MKSISRTAYLKRIEAAKSRIRETIKNDPNPGRRIDIIRREAYQNLQLPGLSDEDIDMLMWIADGCL
jgi:hypothetical protein